MTHSFRALAFRCIVMCWRMLSERFPFSLLQGDSLEPAQYILKTHCGATFFDGNSLHPASQCLSLGRHFLPDQLLMPRQAIKKEICVDTDLPQSCPGLCCSHSGTSRRKRSTCGRPSRRAGGRSRWRSRRMPVPLSELTPCETLRITLGCGPVYIYIVSKCFGCVGRKPVPSCIQS